ncbi:MAG: MFS transporter, partial [Bacteroidota bacterium]|nr:MFS transporter [Bacteroidota bacterium]MDX5430188.1 MFS transporter [Bacteroidota bacterium]MDX5468951.1 MFS transporter [Bacteroidota bacterium]
VAASTVLVGGIIAAVLGPEIAMAGKELLQTPFAGSFVLLAAVFLMSFFILLFYWNVQPKAEETNHTARSLRYFFSLRIFWIALISAAFGYALMSFVMTATPVSMNKIDQFSLLETKRVIQSHVLAMYVPSLFPGLLIRYLGLKRLIQSGAIIYLLCLLIALNGHALGNYWVALILLGLGWNFLFIGGTVLLSKTYSMSERFKIQSLNDLIVLGLQATASLSAGYVVYAMGWDTLLWICLPFMLLLLVLSFDRKLN